MLLPQQDGSAEDILIEGLLNRNRALNGDVVVCVFLPSQASNTENAVEKQSPTKLLSTTPKKTTPYKKKLKENLLKSEKETNRADMSEELTPLSPADSVVNKPKPQNKKKIKKLTETVLSVSQGDVVEKTSSQEKQLSSISGKAEVTDVSFVHIIIFLWKSNFVFFE